MYKSFKSRLIWTIASVIIGGLAGAGAGYLISNGILGWPIYSVGCALGCGFVTLTRD